MKSFVLIAILVFAAACGKDNKSGSQNSNPYISGLTVQESQVKEDFINRGKNIIKNYGASINLYFNQNISSRLVQVLVSENIYLTETVIYPSNNGITRNPTHASVHNSMATFYVGQQYPNANWSNYINNNQRQSDRIVLHILLEMVGIDDSNYQHSTQIISRRR